MKDITLSIPDKDYSFFVKLLKQLDFVQIKDEKKKLSRKKEALAGIKEAVEQVNLAKKGKVKLKSAEQLLNEL